MTPKQQAVIEAARGKGTVVLIPRVRRHTAYENHMKERMARATRAASELLETEQQRLVRTWSK